MFVAALLVVPVLIIDASPASPFWRSVSWTLNWASWLVFLGEVVVMLSVVPNRRAWLRANRLNVVITVVTFPTLAAVFEVLRLFRLARLARLLRLARLVRASEIANKALTPAGIAWSGFFVLMSVLVGAQVFSASESRPGHHAGLWDGVWWAATTTTTVGYGDLYPTTAVGRGVALSLMFVGIGFVAMLTASVAGYAAESRRRLRSDNEEASVQIDGHNDAAVLRELADIQARLARLDAAIRSRPSPAADTDRGTDA